MLLPVHCTCQWHGDVSDFTKKGHFQHLIKMHLSIIHTTRSLLLHADLEKWLRATGSWLKSQLQNPCKGIRLLWLSEHEKRTSCPAPFKDSWFPITLWSTALSAHDGAEMWHVNPAAETQNAAACFPFKAMYLPNDQRKQIFNNSGKN